MVGTKILIVEDEFIVANDISNSLTSMGYAVIGIAASGERAIRKAESESPDLVLMDIMLRGEMDGIEAAKQIHARLNVPVVFLTAYADPHIIDQAKKAEPFGYLIKSFEDRQLKATIEIALDKFQAEEKIRHLALHDTLTGLPNRSLFHDRLTHARYQAYRYQHFVALLYIDLDEFGVINKRFNQESGDMVLKDVANRLTRAVRKTDTVARMGGDEFVVILQYIRRKEDAEFVAKKIIHSISEPVYFNGGSCAIQASIGISIYPYDGLDNDTLRKKADKIMHHVKKSGKNNYGFCDFPNDNHLKNAAPMTQDIALSDNFMPNKEMFYEQLTYGRSRAYHSRNFVALLYVELEQSANAGAPKSADMHAGQSAADQQSGQRTDASVAEKVVSRLRASIRETDMVMQIRENEFVLMLQCIQGKDDAELVAKKVIQSINAPLCVGGKDHMIETSIGISIYPYDGLDNQTLMKKADEVIQAKKSGRNNYYFCDFPFNNSTVKPSK